MRFGEASQRATDLLWILLILVGAVRGVRALPVAAARPLAATASSTASLSGRAAIGTTAARPRCFLEAASARRPIRIATRLAGCLILQTTGAWRPQRLVRIHGWLCSGLPGAFTCLARCSISIGLEDFTGQWRPQQDLVALSQAAEHLDV